MARGDRPSRWKGQVTGVVTGYPGPSLWLCREGSERFREEEVEPVRWEKTWLCLALPSPPGESVPQRQRLGC